ncbi:ATP phosphoribosyltransferase regulatory subunit [Candidatus Daviesbacteria bacterium]|nr:ATP phosphoribosyltransferase regulatory subunit [Candidatus Daviesbacteria bacterium]
MIKAPPTPKGFRDLKPEMAKAKREAINKIVSVLQDSGFVPIDTPTIEFAETLEGKYGEEEKLIYKFTDRGGRKLALRYDLTVPLARYVATYNPPLPFRRYQIGQVFRGENPQKGRFREFTQFDFDSVGSSDPKEDALIIAAAVKSLEALGIKNFKILVNDRSIFAGLPPSVIRIIDKIKKIGREGVIDELIKAGYSEEQLQTIESNGPTENLQNIFKELENLGVAKDKYEFSPTLARGLDYYTGLIIEAEIEEYGGGSVGGGGRYDNLIGIFAKKSIPAVGFSFGLDRLLEIL